MREHRRTAGFPWLETLTISGLSLASAGTVLEYDPYWSVRAGLENLSGTALARADSWSWAPVDAVFYQNSPGWNMVLAQAWDSGGLWGLTALTALSAAALLTISLFLSRALGGGRLVSLLLLAATWLPLSQAFTARATVPSLTLLLASVYAGLLLTRRRYTPWVATWAPGVALLTSVAGNWCHLSWALYAPAAWCAWALMAWRASWRIRQKAIFLAGGAVGFAIGMLTGPYSLPVALDRAQVARLASSHLIDEWVPGLSPMSSVEDLALAVAVLLVSILACGWVVRQWRRQGQAAGPQLAALTGLAAASAALAAAGAAVGTRFLYTSALLALPVLAVALSQWATWAQETALRTGGWQARVAASVRSPMTRRVAGLGAGALVMIGAALALGHQVPAQTRAAAALPAGCRLWATDATADVVLLLRPDVKVWYDGRADYWGHARVLEQVWFQQGTHPSGPVPAGSDCLILAGDEQGKAIAARVRGLGGWRELGSWDGWSTWSRTAAAGAEAT